MQGANFLQNDCVFCDNYYDNATDGIFEMMNEAIFAKHAPDPNQNLQSYVDVLLKIEEPCNHQEAIALAKFSQYQIDDEREEFLKRQYSANEFGSKIETLTEYYKFHKDVPRIIEKGIQKILGRYYDKKRQFDYKKIKKILKQEQGLSITSVEETFSDNSNDEEVQKKSRYSTLLNALEETQNNIEHMSDSKLLKDMCVQIERALPKSKYAENYQFKGNHFQNDLIFQQYIKKQEEKLQAKLRQKQKDRQENKNRKTRKVNLRDILKKTNRYQSKDEKQETEVNELKKKKQKDSKFIYNTNIKIQIRNAMFYSQGQSPLQIGSLDYFNRNSKNDLDNRIRRKNNLINQINVLNHDESSKKMLSDIYKSNQNEAFKKRKNIIGSRERLRTKESKEKEISISRDKKKININAFKNEKNTLTASSSARRIIYGSNQRMKSNSNSKLPSKSLSTTSLKKRSLNLGLGGGINSSKKIQVPYEPPINNISKYGSSDLKMRDGSRQKMKERENVQKEKRAISIKELLNRKLTIFQR